MASLQRDFATKSAGEASFAFSIDGRGGIVSDVRDAYTHAFVLFAIAWLHRVTGDVTLLTLADAHRCVRQDAPRSMRSTAACSTRFRRRRARSGRIR